LDEKLKIRWKFDDAGRKRRKERWGKPQSPITKHKQTIQAIQSEELTRHTIVLGLSMPEKTQITPFYTSRYGPQKAKMLENKSERR
jgi:hypothetical protein